MTNKPEKHQDEEVSDGSASSSDSEEWLKGVAHVPSRPPPRDRVGEKIGHYELKGPLGKGGMGVVYDAVDLRLQRNVALKLLSDDVIDDVERRRRFLREAKLTAKVTHPNIVSLYEVGEIDNHIFLAMERVIGSTLRERLNEAKGGLPTQEAVRITREIALGVAEAHRHGVIHRDIKPENIMIGGDDRVKLLDFGLAKALERAQPSVAYQSTEISAVHGRVVGTLRYMSPEQVRGTGVDERSDVFAIGVVLYEMLSGMRPFRGATNTDVMASILRDVPTPIGNIPQVLWRIVARCLSKNPDERYPNAGALAEALEPRVWASPFTQGLTRYWALLLLLFVMIVVVVRAYSNSAKISEPPKVPVSAVQSPPSAPAPAKPAPIRIVDLPPPKSPNAKAVFHYREALKHFRAANWGAAEDELRTAKDLDPKMAEARFRLALTQMSYGAVRDSAREEFIKATNLKANMTPRDQDLLEAFRPMFEDKVADVAKTLELMVKLSQKYPNDAEIFLYLASFSRFGSIEQRRVAAQTAVDLDKEYADAMQMLSTTWFESKPEKALEILDNCMTVAHSGSDCLGERARIKSLQNDCVGAEIDANLAIEGDRASEWIFAFHPPLLYALGKPSSEVLGSFERLWNRPHSSVTIAEKTYHEAILAAGDGKFLEAKEKAQKGRAVAIEKKNRTDIERFTMLLVEIELEIGNLVGAADIAVEFLDARADMTKSSERPSPTDPTAYLARIAWRSGKISAEKFQGILDAWSKKLSALTPFEQEEMWGLSHVLGIESRAEATEALEKRPGKASAGSKYDYGFKYFPRMAALGRAYWYAEEKETALENLRATYERCDFLLTIFSIMRSNLLYAKALQSRGDTKAACDVYQSIVKRWGNAQPASVTAQEAKKGADAVCSKR